MENRAPGTFRDESNYYRWGCYMHCLSSLSAHPIYRKRLFRTSKKHPNEWPPHFGVNFPPCLVFAYKFVPVVSKFLHEGRNAAFAHHLPMLVTSATTVDFVHAPEGANWRALMIRNDNNLSTIVELTIYLQTTVTSASTLH